MHVTEPQVMVTRSGQQFEARVAWPHVWTDPAARRVLVRRQLTEGHVFVPFGTYVLTLVEGSPNQPKTLKSVMALPPADLESALQAAQALLDGA